MERKGRLRLCTALLICNIVFIWGNSLLPGSVSGAISGWVNELIEFLFPPVDDGSGAGHGLLRKLAHFTEFCVLGILLVWQLRIRKAHGWVCYALPLLGGFLVACVDETIQRFVPDRGPSFIDVGIDTLGTALGIILITLIYACAAMRKNKLNGGKEQ
jgi:VanZ family protein